MATYNAYNALLDQYKKSITSPAPQPEKDTTEEEFLAQFTETPAAEMPETPKMEAVETPVATVEGVDYLQYGMQNVKAAQPMAYAAGGAAPVREAAPAARNVTQEPTVVGGVPAEQVSEADSVADNVPKDVPEGSFVINAPAVEFAGSEDIKKMILDAMKEAERQGIDITQNNTKINKENLVSLVVSKGEVIIPPQLVEIIGLDRLNKINNRGKKEVEERIAENGQDAPPGTQMAAEGGEQGFAQKESPKEQLADTEVIDVYRSIVAQGGDPGRFQVFEKAFQEYQKGKVYRPMQSEVGTPEFDVEVRTKYGYAFPETKGGMLEESTYQRAPD